ncbi:MAG: hypothetical protein ACQ9MH_10870 [Nitrospinales bacterium]
MKKQIIFTVFIFQFFIFLISSLAIAQNNETTDSQDGCNSNREWQQHAPWWGWTPAHDHLKAGKASNCSNQPAKGSSTNGSSAHAISHNNASTNTSNGCESSDKWGKGDSSYEAWWGWTNAHDHLISGKINCGNNATSTAKAKTGLMPDNLFILFDEAKAIKVKGPEGQIIKNYEIDLSQIQEKPFRMRGIHLAELFDGDSYKGRPDDKLTFSKSGKSIISDLEGGKTYVVIKSQKIGRVANTYDMLCAVDRVRGKLKPQSIAPICKQILCSPDFISSSLLFEKFSELAALKTDMQSGMKQGGSISNLQLGGLGLGSMPGGRICDMCTQFSKADVVIPSQDCAFRN